MVHGFGKFLERAFIGERLPALTTIEGEAIRTGAKWSQPKPRIGAVFVGPPHDQVAASHGHAQATGRLACLRAESPRSAPPSATTKRLVGGGQGARCQCANRWLAVQSAQKGLPDGPHGRVGCTRGGCLAWPDVPR